MSSINFSLLPVGTLEQTRTMLENRYKQGRTVNGTRSFHYFSSPKVGVICYKRISDDDIFSGSYTFFNCDSRYNFDAIGKQCFVFCKLDAVYWVGKVADKELSSNEVLISLMHPPFGPSTQLTWPEREDKCWIPTTCIKLILRNPSTVNGEDYIFPKENLAAMEVIVTEKN